MAAMMCHVKTLHLKIQKVCLFYKFLEDSSSDSTDI